MELNLLKQVRETCRATAEQASFVHINYDSLAAYAASLPLDRLARPEHDAGSHYLGHGENTLAFFVTLDAINFGSGYFPHLHKRPGMSGYFSVASSLNDYFRACGPLSAQQLTGLTQVDCAHIFDQDLHNAPIGELMYLFAQALNALGRYLLDQFDGSFVRLVESAQGSGEHLAELLIAMPYFNDVSAYQDRHVHFFKRAQLTAADLWIAFDGQGLGQFTDLDQLTIFADNLVPHVLRTDGMLVYTDDLAARIDRQELISSGSPEEVEIRACALHAVELLSEQLRSLGQSIPPMKLDYLLWNRGQNRHYKARPRHRTRTVFY